MKYKLLCVDMDGTLLNSNKKISDRNIEAVKEASAKGIHIAICTGRLFTSAEYYAELLGVKAPIISANGAYIREKDKDDVIYKAILGKKNCHDILSVLERYGSSINFHTPDRIFTDSMNSPYTRYLKLGKNSPESRNINFEVVEHWEEVFSRYEMDILKCIAVHDDLDIISSAKEDMLGYEGLEVVSSSANNFEVMQKGVSKGRAVEILAGFYDINREEVICIGDNENDLSMIEYAGLGVAMGNSEDMVIRAADYITDTNDNDGVAKAIEKFILA